MGCGVLRPIGLCSVRSEEGDLSVAGGRSEFERKIPEMREIDGIDPAIGARPRVGEGVGDGGHRQNAAAPGQKRTG